MKFEGMREGLIRRSVVGIIAVVATRGALLAQETPSQPWLVRNELV